MNKDFNVSALNDTNPSPQNIKKSNFGSTSSKNLRTSNTHYKPIFGKENMDTKNRSQILLNISNVVPNNNNINNTECSFMTCIDNETKGEIKSMMTVMKNEILDMYTAMMSEIRKDFRKKCEDVKNIENLVNFKLKKIESIQNEFKEINQTFGKITETIDNFTEKSKTNEFSLSEDYKKQIELLVSQKTSFLLEDYNALAKFAAKLEDNLKSEFDTKISKILKEINHDNFLKVLKENSNEFETKLKGTFDDLNGRIKTFEEKIQSFQKRKEEVFWSVKTDFERKFKEGESYFLTQLNVFKSMLNTKIESKDFKNIMEDLMETKVVELRSDLFVNKNALQSQIEEIKNIKEQSQVSLDSINSEIKDALGTITNKLAQMEGCVGNDRNEMALFQEKINEIQENMDNLKSNLSGLQKETEHKIAKENEIKIRDLNEMREIANKIKEKEKKTEGFINELKRDNNFSKVNQLEMLLNELNSNVLRNQDESKILLESLKNKVNTLSAENNRLKEREGFLMKEMEEVNKKQKMMFSLEQNRILKSEYQENKSDTAATNTNTNADFVKTPKNFETFGNKTILPKGINERKAPAPEKKENIYRKENAAKNLNDILDQFEDYDEENSVLSHETENDVFFYPNNASQNNSILSNSSKNREFDNPTTFSNKNTLRSPSPLLKNPFDDHFLETLSKPSDFLVMNRKAVLKKENEVNYSQKEHSKQEKAPSFKDSMSKLSSGSNFYETDKMETIFQSETLQKKNNKFNREEFDQLMRLEYFFKKKNNLNNSGIKSKNEPFAVQIDEAGYLKDESGKYVYDDMGNMIKLSQEQVEFLINKNIIKYI